MAKTAGKELTPMMKQFFDLKAKHPDAVMLFRCGDFYETYCEDAITASKILGITLTHRNNGAGAKGDEMAGFPHHALTSPRVITTPQRIHSHKSKNHLNKRAAILTRVAAFFCYIISKKSLISQEISRNARVQRV